MKFGPSFLFSWKHELGVTKFEGRVSEATGISFL